MVISLDSTKAPIPSSFQVSSFMRFSLASLSKSACSSATHCTVENSKLVYIALVLLTYMVLTSVVLRWAVVLGQFKNPLYPEQASNPRNCHNLQSSYS
jgi:hypothetical protein